MPASSHTNNDTDVVVGTVFFALLLFGIAYLIALFVSGSVGIVKQLANPAAHHDFNATILIWTALPLTALAYLVTPEFARQYSRRVPVALGSAAAGTVAFIIAAVFLTLSIGRPSALEFLAGGLILFITFGIMPTFAVARVATLTNAEVVTARRDDHPIDTGKLAPETARIVKKHCGPSMRRPSGWRPFTLWGDAGRLTHADLQKILALEAAEEQQLAALYRQRAHNTEQESAAAKLKAATDLKADAEREVAALRDEIVRVRDAAEERITHHRAAVTAAEHTSRHWARAAQEASVRYDEVKASAAARALSLTKALEAQTAAAAALRDLSVIKEERGALRARVARLSEERGAFQAALAELTQSRAASREQVARLQKDKDELQARAAANQVLLHRMIAAAERDVARLSDELRYAQKGVATSQPPHRSEQTAAPARAPDTGAPPHLTLVVNHPPIPARFSKPPLRQGMPLRRWRRAQQQLWKQGVRA